MGLGGDDSWSPRVHKEFLLKNKVYHYTYAIEPSLIMGLTLVTSPINPLMVI